jgi:hypothetical protein
MTRRPIGGIDDMDGLLLLVVVRGTLGIGIEN